VTCGGFPGERPASRYVKYVALRKMPMGLVPSWAVYATIPGLMIEIPGAEVSRASLGGSATAHRKVASANSMPSLGLDATTFRPAELPAGHRPVLLVVVDTEEEFDWSAPFNRAHRAVASIAGLVPVHRMFVELGVRPTYVIDHPVAATGHSADIVAAFAADGSAEIGAHLHPWVTPPDEEPVNAFNSYAGNLEPQLERAKLVELRSAILRGTGVRPVTFKAGRYGVAPRTPAFLGELGFRVDLSSSPGFNWSGDGGADFSGARYPNDPYWLRGTPDILEIPTTGGYFGPLRMLGEALIPVDNGRDRRESMLAAFLRKMRLARRAMLTPEGFRLWELQALAESLLARGSRVLTLSWHSPSARPGHTPFVRSEAELQEFVATLRGFTTWFARQHSGRFATASEVLGLVRPADAP
jgi:hypothetical protein